MTSDNHANDRELQGDARAWAAFTGAPYTAALRQMKSPLAGGLLGERIGARHLIAVLEDHELVGSHGGAPVLGDNGYESDGAWRLNREDDYVELALVADFLRMFTPVAAAEGVSSYSLKHTAEWFLPPDFSYVSNGTLIWAAASLGLAMEPADGGGLNLMIGVSEREHDYVRRIIGRGSGEPTAHHHRPAGLDHLRSALDRHAAGEPIGERWIRPVIEPVVAPFHDWLVEQGGRDGGLGRLARDYVAGVRDGDHGIAHSPDDLLAILRSVAAAPEFFDAAVTFITEWMTAVPSTPPVRTELIGQDRTGHDGYGAGGGDVERYEFWCPCGDGSIVEEHDNIPGFREHGVRIACDRCRGQWRFVDPGNAREWGLVPLSLGGSD